MSAEEKVMASKLSALLSLQLWVDMVVRKKLLYNVTDQAERFMLGLSEMAKPGWDLVNGLRPVTVNDINFFVGASCIDVAAWRAHTRTYVPGKTPCHLKQMLCDAQYGCCVVCLWTADSNRLCCHLACKWDIIGA